VLCGESLELSTERLDYRTERMHAVAEVAARRNVRIEIDQLAQRG